MGTRFQCARLDLVVRTLEVNCSVVIYEECAGLTNVHWTAGLTTSGIFNKGEDTGFFHGIIRSCLFY